MGVRLSYRADQADRAYSRLSTQTFHDLNDAVNWARSVAPSDLASFVDTTSGQTLNVGLSLAAGPNFPGALFTEVPAQWGRRWRHVRDRAGSQRVNLHVWGDSVTTNGVGTTDHLTRSFPGLLQYFLQAQLGDGGTGYLSHEYAQQTGTWTYDLYGGTGGTSVRATSTATMTWTGVRGTSIRIYCRNTGVTGSFRYRVDGGAFSAPVVPPNPFTGDFGVIDVPGPLADVPHTLELEWLSGTVFIHGLLARRTTGVVLSRFGQTGRAGSHYSQQLIDRVPSVTTTSGTNTLTVPAPGSFRSLHVGQYVFGPGLPTDVTITGAPSATSAALSANATASGTVTVDVQANRPSLFQAPALTVDSSSVFGVQLGMDRADVLVIALGGVDALSASGSVNGKTFREGISNVIRQYTDDDVLDFTPDTVFVLEHFGDGVDFRDRYGEVVSEARSMAAGLGAAVIDVWGLGERSFKFWNDRGFMFDAVHPNDLGAVVYARPVIDLLMR